MELSTLYKRTKTGAVQYWKVETVDNRDGIAIVKESGQFGTTSPTFHREEIYAGKQGRGMKGQAEFQAESDWKRKHDEGYKTSADLGIPTKDIDPVEYNFAALLEAALPKFNTDASGELLPQLARIKLWTPGCTSYPQLIETKFDGNRSTIVLDLDRTYALSRTGKPQMNINHLTAILDVNIPFGNRTSKVILDGEIYLHGLPLEEINEAIKKVNENSPKLQFMIYDLPLLDDDQEVRSATVQAFSEQLDSPFFPYSKVHVVESDEDVMQFHDEQLEAGFEGAIVKNPKSKYQPGQRNNDWKKVKARDENEFEITGHTFGQRGAQDLKFICACSAGSFEVTMNGSIATKERLAAKAESLIGKMLTVEHKGYTKYGIPNHAKGKAIRDHE